MDIQNIKFSLLLEGATAEKPREQNIEVLNIRVMLGERGLYLAIEAGRANKMAFDSIMGPGWTAHFGNEVGDVLEQSRALDKLLLERGREIRVKGEERLRKEGRL